MPQKTTSERIATALEDIVKAFRPPVNAGLAGKPDEIWSPKDIKNYTDAQLYEGTWREGLFA